jgi:peptide/nickel transport system permease protein
VAVDLRVRLWSQDARQGVGNLLIGRLARLALLLVSVTIATFGLLEFSPVDPVNAYIGSEVTRIGPEQREQIAER